MISPLNSTDIGEEEIHLTPIRREIIHLLQTALSDIAGSDLKDVTKLASAYLKWRHNRPQRMLRRFLHERLRDKASTLYNLMSLSHVAPTTPEYVAVDFRYMQLGQYILDAADSQPPIIPAIPTDNESVCHQQIKREGFQQMQMPSRQMPSDARCQQMPSRLWLIPQSTKLSKRSTLNGIN